MIGKANGAVWQERLDHLKDVVSQDVENGKYFGAVVQVARAGKPVFFEAIGSADAQGAKPLSLNSVFSIFSVTKAFVNVLVLRAIELGRFALTTKVSEIIPEFAGPPRERVTFFHLLSHTSGMPGVWSLSPTLLVDRLEDVLQEILKNWHGVVEPGTRCDYSPMINHVLMAEALRRTDSKGRAFRDILREDLFEPLGMQDTSIGVRSDLQPRHVVPDMRGTLPIELRGRTKPGPYGMFEEEDAEMPWAGAVSTVGDLGKFTDMLRAGGIREGVRILSPATIALARKNWTGQMPNELYKTVALRAGWTPPPAYIGLGFNVRGEGIVNHQLGTLTSPETFGNYGSGSAVFWVDPALDVTFVGLTAGLLSQAANIERFQRLSDIAVSAIV